MAKFINKQSIKKILGLFIGFGAPLLFFLEKQTGSWIILLCILFSVIGAGLITKFSDFKYEIKGLDGTDGKVDINQTWGLFLISLISNLIISILIIFYNGSSN